MGTPTTRTAATTSTRTDLLDGAYRVLLRDGPERLTLDAVVRETGRSKGGVLYHFPTKDALIAGMVGHIHDRFDAAVEARWEAAGDRSPGSWLRAYLAVSVAPDPDNAALLPALLPVIAANLALLDIARERAVQTQARIAADGVDPAIATVVRLAADGLGMDDLFGFAPLGDDLRRRVLAVVEAMTRTHPA
jgi:AcrR family transcriptional regulator